MQIYGNDPGRAMKTTYIHLVAVSVCSAVASLPWAEPTVTLDYAVLRGSQTTLPDALVPVNKFLGVPYAEKPERFSKATKPLARKQPIDATEFGPSCIQSLGIPGQSGPCPLPAQPII
jgi:hypothetical protein